MNEVRLKHWSLEGDKAKLDYDDNSTLYVTKEDFKRAFGCIVGLTKEEALRDFAIKTDAEIYKVSFFCPLEGHIDDEEYGEYQLAEDWLLSSHEWDIRERLKLEQKSPEDAMAQYFNENDSIKSKLISAVWTVDEYDGKLYGRIDCSFKEPLTEEETEIFKDWIVGQNADGFGEGFEQRPIATEDGDLYVSFWNGSDSYFVCTEDELAETIANMNVTKMGGM